MPEFTKEFVDGEFKKNGILKVTFTKADGSTRVMVCTKDLDNVPEEHHPKGEGEDRPGRKPNDLLCNVYEIGVGWRSFYYAKVQDIEVPE